MLLCEGSPGAAGDKQQKGVCFPPEGGLSDSGIGEGAKGGYV